MIESVLASYEDIAVAPTEIDLSSLAPYLPPQAIDALQNAIYGVVAPILEENQALRDQVARQGEEIADLREEVALERAHDRRRIASLEAEENKPKTVTSFPKASQHIEKLFDLMLQSGLKQVSVSNAAKMLGISRMHMHRLKATLGSDCRFVVVRDPHHKQRHLIRLV